MSPFTGAKIKKLYYVFIRVLQTFSFLQSVAL
uniref:Uncharacterized protein n=1 Tax=Anguilla anguilla TaxID=7936 RepID=A0A0E9S536_ANGAN